MRPAIISGCSCIRGRSGPHQVVSVKGEAVLKTCLAVFAGGGMAGKLRGAGSEQPEISLVCTVCRQCR
jgi:hypothetical protein